MKISKISLILLSGLLVTQATLPMEIPANSALKKAQKAGKIALRIGAGTATFGVYALLGTAALASWGITLGAAALSAVSLARFLIPKTAKPIVPTPTPEVAKNQATGTQKSPVKRPQLAPKIKSERPLKNTRTARYTEGMKAASMIGLAAVENNTLDTQTLKENRMTHEQVKELRRKQALALQVVLENCKDQSIEWNKNYTRTYHAELPRYEGPYQDMIGIYDADLEDIKDDLRFDMNAQIAHNWERSGCQDSMAKLQTLARRMAQDQMRLSNNI